MKEKPSLSLLRYLFINLVLISCNQSKSPLSVNNKDYNDIDTVHIPVIDLKRLPGLSTVKLSEIGATEIEYIPLKTTSKNVIPQINNIIFSKNYFLTRGLSSLNMFRNDGSFITEVGNKGRGPFEYIGITDVDINPENESIYIASGGQQKFLVVNKNGKVVRTFKSPLRGRMNFKFTEDGILCYYINDMGNIENSFILTDTTGKIVKKFKNKYPWKRISPGVFYDENIFYRFNNQLLKKEIYCDTIFVWHDKVFEPHIIIDVGTQRLTPDARSNIRTRSDAESVLNNYIEPWNLFEFGDFIYYEIVTTLNGVHDLFSFIGTKKDNFRALFVSNEGLINDLDGGPAFWPKTIKDDSTIVSWIEALKFRQYIASNEFKNSKPKYPEKKKELENLTKVIQDNDNPILVLIKVK